jgi:hypothetical protein
LGNTVVRGIMWCFLRVGTRKKHHMCSHTPEIPNDPILILQKEAWLASIMEFPGLSAGKAARPR